jgi:hypothetical protein
MRSQLSFPNILSANGNFYQAQLHGFSCQTSADHITIMPPPVSAHTLTGTDPPRTPVDTEPTGTPVDTEPTSTPAERVAVLPEPQTRSISPEVTAQPNRRISPEVTPGDDSGVIELGATGEAEQSDRGSPPVNPHTTKLRSNTPAPEPAMTSDVCAYHHGQEVTITVRRPNVAACQVRGVVLYFMPDKDEYKVQYVWKLDQRTYEERFNISDMGPATEDVKAVLTKLETKKATNADNKRKRDEKKAQQEEEQQEPEPEPEPEPEKATPKKSKKPKKTVSSIKNKTASMPAQSQMTQNTQSECGTLTVGMEVYYIVGSRLLQGVIQLYDALLGQYTVRYILPTDAGQLEYISNIPGNSLAVVPEAHKYLATYICLIPPTPVSSTTVYVDV